MTAPFVTTVTKPAAAGGRSSLRRALLVVAVLLPLTLALLLLAWLVTPKLDGHRATWLDRLFGDDQEQHTETNVCSLPLVAGPCRGALQRYHYSTESGTCSAFLYGGCEGNSNNFKTLDECVTSCGPQTRNKELQRAGGVVCSLPAQVGDCRAALPRFFFDAGSSTCRQFIYGGCGGNANNFETRQECELLCLPSERAVEGDCTSEPNSGVCMAYMEKFAYDPSTRTCEKFVYGGCGGNGNRYENKEECEARCGQTAETGQESTDSPLEGADSLHEGIDYDTKLCGVGECPADCGLAGHQGDCVLCQCGQTPFLEAGEVAVAAGEPCPEGYVLVREDFSSHVCSPGEPVPAV